MYNTIYPGYVQSYYNINHNQLQHNNKQVQQKADDEKNSRPSNNTERENFSREKNSAQSGFYFPNGEKSAVDYTKTINIDQILSDFKNTANAIGAPENVKQEVSAYLSLAENAAVKENPDRELIQSNLKNASKILDEYIAETLKKPSKVVSEWVNTLFLQPVDLKSRKIAENEQPQLNEQTAKETAEKEAAPAQSESIEIIEEKKEAETAEEQTLHAPQKTQEVYIPKDSRLKNMFIQAKKYAAADKKQEALYICQNLMKYAEETSDERLQAMIHYEEANIYNDFNRPEEALYNYAIAALQTDDNNLKARSYLSMGRIYDDYINFEPALDNYAAAVGYAGEADNLKLQSTAFSDLAKLHAQRYDKNNADIFMQLASDCADNASDEKLTGVIYAKNAKMQNKLGDKSRALSSYGVSAGAYSKIGDNENLARDYREAALIMYRYGNSAKAGTLLNKAYAAVQSTDNIELKMLIRQDMQNIAAGSAA